MTARRRTLLTRRSLLAGGAAIAAGSLLPVPTRRAQAATETLIWQQWGPLNGYGVSAECNPGNHTSFSCGTADVAIGTDATGQFTQVTANPRAITTFVNAIGNIHFRNTTPDGQPIRLTTYHYVVAFRLPNPVTTTPPWIGEQMHAMIQFWDGAGALWPNPNRVTLEAAAFWKLNPWDPDFKKIMVYSLQNGAVTPVDTKIVLEPDESWHYIEVSANLATQTWVGIGVDGGWTPLGGLPLAQVQHTDWGTDLSLILTAESENAYPGTNPIVTQWTTDFKDVKLYRQD